MNIKYSAQILCAVVFLILGFFLNWLFRGVGVVNTVPQIVYLPVLFFLIAALFLFFGLKGLVQNPPYQKKRLLQEGQKIVATITNIDQDYSLSINRRVPFVIFCEWSDPATQKKYTFKSDFIWMDPHFMLKDQRNIDVYIDPANPNKNLVDLASIGIVQKTDASRLMNMIFLFAAIMFAGTFFVLMKFLPIGSK